VPYLGCCGSLECVEDVSMGVGKYCLESSGPVAEASSEPDAEESPDAEASAVPELEYEPSAQPETPAGCVAHLKPCSKGSPCCDGVCTPYGEGKASYCIMPTMRTSVAAMIM
jgi:hypothetical protein